MPTKKNVTTNSTLGGIGGILIVAWILLGIAAFIMSIVCFGRGGDTTQNVIGLLLSIILGPFYFIYYYIMKPKGYCT